MNTVIVLGKKTRDNTYVSNYNTIVQDKFL